MVCVAVDCWMKETSQINDLQPPRMSDLGKTQLPKSPFVSSGALKCWHHANSPSQTAHNSLPRFSPFSHLRKPPPLLKWRLSSKASCWSKKNHLEPSAVPLEHRPICDGPLQSCPCTTSVQVRLLKLWHTGNWMRWWHEGGGQVQCKHKRLCRQFDIVERCATVLWPAVRKKEKQRLRIRETLMTAHVRQSEVLLERSFTRLHS